MHQRGALKGQATVVAGSFWGVVVAVEAKKREKEKRPQTVHQINEQGNLP
jgi:hypothetical protein